NSYGNGPVLRFVVIRPDYIQRNENEVRQARVIRVGLPGVMTSCTVSSFRVSAFPPIDFLSAIGFLLVDLAEDFCRPLRRARFVRELFHSKESVKIDRRLTGFQNE